MAGTGYRRWTPDELLRVAVHALPLADTGDKFEMLKIGMRTSLPRQRWKSLADLKRQTAPSFWKSIEKYLQQAARMSETERDAIIKQTAVELEPKALGEVLADPEQVVREMAQEPVNKPRSIRWNDLEWALIARRVKWMRDQGDTRENLARIIFDAQAYELRPERRRALGGLLQSQYSSPSSNRDPSHTNEGMLNTGMLNIGRLLRGQPFKPEGNFAAPPAADEPQAAADEPPTFIVPSTIAEMRAVQGVPGHIDPGPLPDENETLQQKIAKAFAQQMQTAVEGMLKAHADAITDALQGVMQREMAQWAASMERTLRHGVHHVLERELGGSVGGPPTGPAAPEAPAPAPEAPPEPAKRLRVDVVGLVGQNIELVKKSFNGSVDLRFIDPDQITAWAPHSGRHAVVTLKWVPHKAKDKLRTVGVVPNMVMGGVGSVIQAIEKLAREQGVELTH